jgi:hypothetical protein
MWNTGKSKLLLLSAGCEIRKGQDILVAHGGFRGNLLRVAERIDDDGVVRLEARKAEIPHPSIVFLRPTASGKGAMHVAGAGETMP